MATNSIKIVSWNVNGIQNVVKRYKILAHIRTLGSDIAMLQETHLKNEESLKLKQRWVGQVFSSPGGRGTKGVSILISKKISFNLIDSVCDKEGRYLVLHGTLQNEKCTLVNIYAPNSAQASFLSSLCTLLAKIVGSPIVLGGDFNLIKEASLDRSGHPLPMDTSLSRAFKELLESFGLVDVWRLLNPHSREYTFYSKVHNSYSRIDYLLVSDSLIKNVINAEIHSILISDHAPQPDSLLHGGMGA
uniref:exodeoxyribonuclease III n=1 Tax=Myripristis murdjan TaxID=586833 RepID=A0A667X9Y1_9TELE